MQLQDYLAINVFQFLLVFARLSLVFVMMPGFSAVYVPARVRLVVGLLVALVVLPLVRPYLPPEPTTPAQLARDVVGEMLIGGFFGALIQIIMASLELAGQLISSTAGITNALTDDPITQEQSSIIIGLINMVAMVMIFVTGTHLIMITAVVDSYSLLVPGGAMFTGDMLTMVSRLTDATFSMGIRLAAPFLVFELVFQVTSGILARLSPQLNVFFVVLPGKIVLGLAILMISLPAIMLMFMHFMDNTLHGLLTPLATSTPVR